MCCPAQRSRRQAPSRSSRPLLGVLFMCTACALFPIMNGLVKLLAATYDLASDPRGQLIRQFQSTLLPTTVLIRADGTVARIRSGTVSADELQNWIEQDLLS